MPMVFTGASVAIVLVMCLATWSLKFRYSQDPNSGNPNTKHPNTGHPKTRNIQIAIFLSSRGGLVVALWTDNSLPVATVDRIPLVSRYNSFCYGNKSIKLILDECQIYLLITVHKYVHKFKRYFCRLKTFNWTLINSQWLRLCAPRGCGSRFSCL